MSAEVRYAEEAAAMRVALKAAEDALADAEAAINAMELPDTWVKVRAARTVALYVLKGYAAC